MCEYYTTLNLDRCPFCKKPFRRNPRKKSDGRPIKRREIDPHKYGVVV